MKFFVYFCLILSLVSGGISQCTVYEPSTLLIPCGINTLTGWLDINSNTSIQYDILRIDSLDNMVLQGTKTNDGSMNYTSTLSVVPCDLNMNNNGPYHILIKAFLQPDLDNQIYNCSSMEFNYTSCGNMLFDPDL